MPCSVDACSTHTHVGAHTTHACPKIPAEHSLAHTGTHPQSEEVYERTKEGQERKGKKRSFLFDNKKSPFTHRSCGKGIIVGDDCNGWRKRVLFAPETSSSCLIRKLKRLSCMYTPLHLSRQPSLFDARKKRRKKRDVLTRACRRLSHTSECIR